MTLTLKWWMPVAGVALLVVTFLVGRGSVHGGGGSATISPPAVTRDGGVPEAVASVASDGGYYFTSYSCKVEPAKVIYRDRPIAGTAPICPEVTCPALECSGTASAQAPQTSATADAPVLPPQVVTIHEVQPFGKWGIGLQGLYVPSKASLGGHVAWRPLKELEVQLGGTSNPSVNLNVTFFPTF